jgi:hypothetical protein
MIVTSKTFKHENKCLNCGKGQLDHRSHDQACPLLTKVKSYHQSFNEMGVKFMDSGSPTARSKNKLKKLLADEKRQDESTEAQEHEKNKIRAMTLNEVVHEARAILRRFTGLGSEIESKWAGDTVEIYLVANGVRLGFTSMTKTILGSYIVGSSAGGCFMANGTDRDVKQVVASAFEELEDRANKEKSQ